MAALLIGPIVSLVTSIVDRIWPDATKKEEIKGQLTLALMKGEYDNELQSIMSVNATMQAEAKSEHWAQWVWRPTIGLSFSAVIVNNFILLPYFAKFGLQPIVIPDNVWTAMLVILGAAAATRGWQKVEEAKKG